MPLAIYDINDDQIKDAVYDALVLSTKNAYRSKMEAAYSLTSNPLYQPVELEKAGAIIGELFAEIVMPYIQENSQLSANVANSNVNDFGTPTETLIGHLVNDSVSGSIN